MGFCKIPRALVKRYACELRRSIDAVGQCIENERLDQLKKLGKLGVSCICAVHAQIDSFINWIYYFKRFQMIFIWLDFACVPKTWWVKKLTEVFGACVNVTLTRQVTKASFISSVFRCMSILGVTGCGFLMSISSNICWTWIELILNSNWKLETRITCMSCVLQFRRLGQWI